jgi:hypothetical protein
MRLGCMALVGGIACLVFGYKGCSDSVKFREPVKVTAKQFLQQKPQEGWFNVTGGTILLTEAKFEVKQSKYSTKEPTVENAETFYLPVHAGDDVDSKTTLVLKTHDDSIKSKMLELDNMSKDLESKSEAEQKAWFVQNMDKIVIRHDIKGLVEAGVQENGSDNAELAKLGEELGPSFVVIEEGTEPAGMGKAIGMAIGGVALLLVSLFLFGVRPGNRN